MYSIGIDIGYSSVKVILTDEENACKFCRYRLHKGRIQDTLEDILRDLTETFDPKDIRYGAVTGSGSTFLSADGTVKAVNDVTAVIEGAVAENGEIGSIIDIGGENARFITGLGNGNKANIEISMNSNCSSGTGAFLEEQMSRLNLSLTDYTDLVKKAKSIPRIAGRCSVFAKTDITHHQQEGVPIPDILLGLAYAFARNYKGTVMKKSTVRKPLFFSGGVAHNEGIVTALKDVLHLQEGDLLFPSRLGCVGVFGAAVIARKERFAVDMDKVLLSVEHAEEKRTVPGDGTVLPQLAAYGKNDGVGKHTCTAIPNGRSITDCYLGVDIGSTSTNFRIDRHERDYRFPYVSTDAGNPVEAVLRGFAKTKAELGKKIRIVGAATTGSGRYMIGRMIGADVIKDEITAQAKAAVEIDGDVDTIFEIGGQDSKFISLKNGAVVDFQMNKICAAGTGSFIEEQAKKFSIPIEDFGDLALSSDNPIFLGERCTVFIESCIAANLAQGAALNDIAAGLCYSIVRNYLDRVVGQKKVGNKIFFQGGLAYNQGVVNAFRAVTGKKIVVPPYFSVTGAYGAALLAKEEMTGQASSFKGFDVTADDAAVRLPAETKKQSDKPDFARSVEKLIFTDYVPERSGKKTIGIPRALFTYGMFPMFNTFFTELGLDVVLSEPTDEKTIAMGQQYALDETCYPIKLITGHVAQLMEQHVDYLFFPSLVTVDHPGSPSRKNYGCAYMQKAAQIMNRTMDLDKRGITLLSPTLTFHMGKDAVFGSFVEIGRQLGKTQKETAKALAKGMEALDRFEKRMNENSRTVMADLKPKEKALVIISKIYGVVDPVLNMGIPDKLADMGYKVIPFYELPEDDMSAEHPNMFWPFGQHILEAARQVRKHPNLYAVLLTHHGCGPDSVLSHYFREEMQGKPYLHIEMDEHSSGVGIITRMEAFTNSLKNLEPEEAGSAETHRRDSGPEATNILNGLSGLSTGTTVYVPYAFPYSEIFCRSLTVQGIDAKPLPPSNRNSVTTGRKYTITEEYFSLTALLGNVFSKLHDLGNSNAGSAAFLVSQNEGAETDGQYSRLLRTKLDEEGFKNVSVVSPFREDLLCTDDKTFDTIVMTLLAGDSVLCAPHESRTSYLNAIFALIQEGRFDTEHVLPIVRAIAKEPEIERPCKRILAVGEIPILFDEFLNNNTFAELENDGYRIFYSPLSEALWMMWKDFANQNEIKRPSLAAKRLETMKRTMLAVSGELADRSPFEQDPDDLIREADRTLGYFSGALGRYRLAKQLRAPQTADGIITACSMYENTGIVLSILQKSFDGERTKPVLNLTFDGTKNENDRIKIESFLYYL